MREEYENRGNFDHSEGTDISLKLGQYLISWESLCESFKCGHNMHIQAGYPEPCKFPGSNSCKACVCLLNSMPQHQLLPLGHCPRFQLETQRLAVINDSVLKQEMADNLPLHRVHALCAFIMTVHLNRGALGPEFSF